MDLTRFEPLLHSRSRLIQSTLRFAESIYRFGQRVSAARTARRIERGEWPLSLPVPVISIGNVVAGGVGKTPLVEAIARAHRARGGHPGLLSRGYGAQGPQGNDEAQLLARRLPDVPHVQNRDRHVGGTELLAAHPEIDLILLDDGFQHRRLHRDLDVVVIDATRPFGFGHLLPRGYLREPWRGIDRAGAIVVTRGADASQHKRAILAAFLEARVSSRGCPVLWAETKIEGTRSLDGSRSPVTGGRRAAAFAGIGNPGAFFLGLRRAGYDVVHERAFPDHHAFTVDDVQSVTREAEANGAEVLLCTEKDGVKIEAIAGDTAALPIEQIAMHFELDVDAILDRLAAEVSEPR